MPRKSRTPPPPSPWELRYTAYSRAVSIFRDVLDAREWLEAECRALNYAKPLDLLTDEEGLERVLAALDRVERNNYT